MPRLAPLHPKDMSDAQLDFYRTIKKRASYAAAAADAPLAGPSSVYQRSVPYGELKNDLSRYLRHGGLLSARLTELAILTVTRLWNTAYVFNEHTHIAEGEGVSGEVIHAIRQGNAPSFDKLDEEIVYHFVYQLTDAKTVNDETYQAAVDLLGEATLVELVGLCGHYVTACMTLNAFEMPHSDEDEALPSI